MPAAAREIRSVSAQQVRCNQLTLLLPVLHTLRLVDSRSEVCRVTSEGDLERCQELVHASKQRLRPDGQLLVRTRVAPAGGAYGVAVADIAGVPLNTTTRSAR